MLKDSEGDMSLQLQWFLQFAPVIGSRELYGKGAKGGIGFGGDNWNIPAGARATGGCCYGDQWAEIRQSLTSQKLIDVGLARNMKRGPANEACKQVAVVGSIWGFGDKRDGTVIDCIQFAE
jgi:hypothetical protein